MTDDQIKHMTERFLGWKLPEDFNPDDGISFEPEYTTHPWPTKARRNPTGTNLFSYTQAEAMVRHMVEGFPMTDTLSPTEAKPGDALADEPQHDALTYATAIRDTVAGYEPEAKKRFGGVLLDCATALEACAAEIAALRTPAPPPTGDEPVAWLYALGADAERVELHRYPSLVERGWTETPLYAHAPPAPTGDVAALVERLEDDAARLMGQGIERGCVDCGLATNLASEAAAALISHSAREKGLREALERIASLPHHSRHDVYENLDMMEKIACKALEQGEGQP